MGHDVIRHLAGWNFAGPAHHRRHPIRPLPVGVLLAAERRDTRVGPGVVVHPVVRRVEDDRVIGNAKLVELIEHLADQLVVGHHHVVIKTLT